MRAIILALLVLLLGGTAVAQDEGTARLVTEVSGTKNYGAIMPGGRAGAHYTFADTDGVHQTRYFSVKAEQANVCIDSDIATADATTAVEVRRVVSANTYAGSVNHLGAGNFLENDGCIVLPGNNQYYFYIAAAPGAGVTADILLTGGTSTGTDHTVPQTLSGLHAFSNTGITTFAGLVQATGFVADAAAVPSVIFDSTGSTGTDDGGVQLTECLAAQGCSMDLYVNSGADTKTGMIRIETSAAGASTVQIAANTPGDAMTNYIDIDEAGKLSPQGTASIVGFTEHLWDATDMATDATECEATSVETTAAGSVQSIRCPHPTAGSAGSGDGFIYGQATLNPTYDPDVSLFFQLNGIVYADPGTGVWYGTMAIQCLTTSEPLSASWDAEVTKDLTFSNHFIVGDVVLWNYFAVDGSAGGADCAANDVLYWRYKSCDTDATPSTNCTSSAGFEAAIEIVGMRLEYSGGLSGL